MSASYYHAIPLLAYVPIADPVHSTPSFYHERISSILRQFGYAPLFAEDFEDATVTLEHGQDLDAFITRVCRSTQPDARPTAFTGDFDPKAGFDSEQDVIRQCIAQPDPIAALAAVIAEFIHQDEFGLAAEVLKRFPNGPLPKTQATPREIDASTDQGPDTQKTLREACKLLSDLGASFEHPGVICIDMQLPHMPILFTFGDANGPFGYNYGQADGDCCQYAGKETLPPDATPHALAAWIREQIAKTLPTLHDHAHLTIVVPYYSAAVHAATADPYLHAELCPDGFHIYEEDMADSERVLRFACEHHLPLYVTFPDHPAILVRPAFPPFEASRGRSQDGFTDGSRTNADRATDASSALRHPADFTESDNYSDLITDILHLAHSKGLDPYHILETARRDFTQEAGHLSH